MEGRPFTQQELSKIVANPFYCLSAVHPIFAQVHEPLISEEMWAGAAAAAIKDMGAEKLLPISLSFPCCQDRCGQEDCVFPLLIH